MQASAAHQVVPRCRVATKCLPCGARGEARHSAGLRFWLTPLAEEFTVPDCPQGRRSTRRFAKHHDEVSDGAQGSVGDQQSFLCERNETTSARVRAARGRIGDGRNSAHLRDRGGRQENMGRRKCLRRKTRSSESCRCAAMRRFGRKSTTSVRVGGRGSGGIEATFKSRPRDASRRRKTGGEALRRAAPGAEIHDP